MNIHGRVNVPVGEAIQIQRIASVRGHSRLIGLLYPVMEHRDHGAVEEHEAPVNLRRVSRACSEVPLFQGIHTFKFRLDP